MPVPNQNITLEEFVEHMSKHLQNFQQMWRQGQAEALENWPEKMNESDWLEHFLIFLELKPSK